MKERKSPVRRRAQRNLGPAMQTTNILGFSFHKLLQNNVVIRLSKDIFY